jgi:hypothetical protein
MPARTSKAPRSWEKTTLWCESPTQDCKVEAKKVPKELIMVGKSPYASEQYAEAAIRTFPECKPEAKKDSKQ